MNEDARMRTRNESVCRATTSRNGEFSPKINAITASRVTYYCKLTNKNRTKFVEECINAQLDILEDEYYQSLSKDELIELIRKGK